MTHRKRHIVRIAVTLLAVPLFGAMMFGFAADEQEQTIKLADVPEAIQKALSKLEADDVEIEAAMQDGQRVYEVEFEADDAEVELTLSEDGTLLSVEVEEDDDADDGDE
ncbi:MAG: PepSY domain-containing protein [Planctomycetaceae bacterium]